jgi:TRAP-type C4-dicarboxylate transport system substrate-binding protein
MINAVSLPPLFALLNESYRQAPHMIGVKWTPLIGGTVISKKAWDQIPEKYRPAMLESAQEAGNRLRGEIRKLGEEAVEEMQKRGLNVIALNAAAQAKWELEAQRAYPKLRGRYAPADLFDEVRRLREEFRKLRAATIAEKVPGQ